MIERAHACEKESSYGGSPTTEQERPLFLGRWRGRLGRAATVLTMSATLFPVANPPLLATEKPDSGTVATYGRGLRTDVYPLLPTENLQECPPVPEKDLELAHDLTQYGEPISQGRAWLENNGLLPEYSPDLNNFEEEDRENGVKYKAAADEYGLTIHDIVPYGQAMYADMAMMLENGGQSRLKFADYFGQAKSFLALYGVELELGDAATKNDTHYGLMTAEEPVLESEAVKWNIYEIMQAFASLPDEYVRDIAKVKRIVLLQGDVASRVDEKALAYAIENAGENEIRYDIAANGRRYAAIFHEIFHHADKEMCGGWSAAVNDPSFTRHTASGVHYATGAASYESIQGKGRLPQPADSLFADRITRDEMTHAYNCRNKEYLAKKFGKVSFADAYAAEKNPLEDKADTSKFMTAEDGRGTITDELMPQRVREKYEELLGRFVQVDPRVAYYFTATQDQDDEHTESLRRCEGIYAPYGIASAVWARR